MPIVERGHDQHVPPLVRVAQVVEPARETPLGKVGNVKCESQGGDEVSDDQLWEKHLDPGGGGAA